MSRCPSDHLKQVQRLSAAMQARTKAENAAVTSTAQAALQRAAEKEASAALLIKQHDERCSKNPRSRLLAPTVALWEGAYALLDQARDLRRLADEASAVSSAAPAAPLNTSTHRVTAGS